MTKKWRRERQRDYYHRRAKEKGYRSRAAFKLLQAVEKHNFINKGDVVVDFGAAPGSWMQVARELVDDEGFVLGIDLKMIPKFDSTNVTILQGDVEKLIGADIMRVLPRQADVVLSDLSPNVSGVWDLDHARQIHLSEISLNLACEVLRVGGAFFVKVFEGSSLKEFRRRVNTHFTQIRVLKPKATRKRSAEIYVMARNYRD
ncbi:MAG: RlmE family RNA methyltransferase [Candidatus Bathyarchaeota archaeon]|nr:MAG: RlmE family RNA methyltransferase [Candidatus Bathyarchaeota archaeon]